MEKAPAELEFLDSYVDKGLLERLTHVAESEFAHVTYTEAVNCWKRTMNTLSIRLSGARICRQNMSGT